MPDDLRSSIKRYLVVHWIDPERDTQRFYSLMIQRDLLGTIRLVRHWRRISTKGPEQVEIYAEEIAAGQALEVLAQLKRRGYRDL